MMNLVREDRESNIMDSKTLSTLVSFLTIHLSSL